MKLALFLVLLLGLLQLYSCISTNKGDKFQPLNLKTFGTGQSAVVGYDNKETLVFNYTVSQNAQFAALDYMWFTSGVADIKNTILRLYLDENLPQNQTIEFDLYLGFGIAFGNEDLFDTTENGKGALTGGLYQYFRIPFTKTCRITVQMPPGTGVNGFYYLVRGVENMPVIINGIPLPPNARMNLYKNENVTLQPLEFLDLVNVNNTAGAVFLTVMQIQSSQNFNFLEGCFRAFSPPGENKWIVGTGTEDYFQSAYYFNGGPFHHNEAGVTYLNSANNTNLEIGLYKFHTKDSFFFDSNGLQFTWRNGDTNTNYGQKCIDDNGIVVGSPQISYVTSYTWYYTWN